MATTNISQPRDNHPSASSFWNCGLRADELILLAVGLCGSVLLHLTPVLDSGMAKPILVILGIVCMLRPVSGFFFIGASAILPTASADVYMHVAEMAQAGEKTAGIVDSGTQFAFFSWVVAFLLVYRKFDIKILALSAPVVPWIFWMTLTSGVSFVMNPDLLKSLLFSVMAAQLAQASGGQFLKCLMGLGLGLLVVSVGFWAREAGLPVQLLNWGGERGGFERLGGAVADSVMLWPAILTGLGAMIGVAAFLQSRGSAGVSGWTKILAFGGFFVSLVPLISSMTNSAILGIGVILGAYAASAFGSGRKVAGKQASRGGPVVLLAGLAAVVVVVVMTDAFDSQQKLEGLWKTYQEQAEEMGVVASRNEVWDCSIDTISRYPLFGYIFSGGVEKIPSQYAAKGYYLSHNVFLDFGRQGGIPGMLLFAYFFFYPVLQAYKTGRPFHFLAFLLAMLAQLLFFTSLSFWTYKPFWALWMLFMVAGGDVMKRIEVMKRRGLTRKWRSLGFTESREPILAEA